LGLVGALAEIVTIFDKFCIFFKTLPVDHVTQVPHPGTAGLRCTFPCTRSLSCSRVKFPEAASGDPEGGGSVTQRALIVAAVVLIDMEDTLRSL
jgi:hypothetical protein